MELEFDLPDGEPPTQELVMEAMIEELVAQGSVDLVKFVKLGRVLDELERGTSKESLGKFGIGVRAVLGDKAPASRKVLNLLLDIIYDTADVPRAGVPRP